VVRIGALAAASCVACGALIGLERLPGLPPDELDASAEAGPLRYCSEADGSLFCDDFDEPDGGDRWRGFLLPSPLVVGAATFGIVQPQVPAPGSAPNAAEFSASREGESSSGAQLLHTVPLPPGTTAVEVSAYVRLLRAEVQTDAASFVPEAGDALIYTMPRVAVMQVAVPGEGSAVGVQIVMSASYIAVGTGTVVSSRPELYERVAAFDVLGAARLAWLRLTVAFGNRELVIRRAREAGRAVTCPPDENVAAVWPLVPTDAVTCVPLRRGLAGEKELALFAGAAVGDPASATVLLDSVRVDPIR